eukprot:CAMPEP_0114564208 /NCGR_PEP_ID=MMETSP0114-20121206/13574_1 /TAXON_ID=31324 /ORGANISM="Goniomonas sp, Strain m" /LENGTH=32 /DNA_ID= /DNA_START= /DNA_END= /DNA_ORIENTATION=
MPKLVSSSVNAKSSIAPANVVPAFDIVAEALR